MRCDGDAVFQERSTDVAGGFQNRLQVLADLKVDICIRNSIM